MKEAVRETISFLTQTQRLDPEDAYSLASIGIDFEVSQVVDINSGIQPASTNTSSPTPDPLDEPDGSRRCCTGG